jgi:hypothetical protein
MVGLLPLFAAVRIDEALWEALPDFRARSRWFIRHNPWLKEFLRFNPDDDRPMLLSLLDPGQLRRVLGRMLDEQEFLAPHGLRSLSRYHQEHPLVVQLPGGEARLDYEPGESETGLFGGNSNWRGPVWFPLNFLALESLRHLDACLGKEFEVELPTGSGRTAALAQVADELERRLLTLFLRDEQGHRPAGGVPDAFRRDPEWPDPILFHEYFHGDTGEGLGASHQTGWTALAGALIADRRRRKGT